LGSRSPGAGAGAGAVGGGGGGRGVGFGETRTGTLTMRGKRGLGDDGSEAVKRHPWFRGVDWDSTSSPFSLLSFSRLSRLPFSVLRKSPEPYLLAIYCQSEWL
jgi:hypothetical protein